MWVMTINDGIPIQRSCKLLSNCFCSYSPKIINVFLSYSEILILSCQEENPKLFWAGQWIWGWRYTTTEINGSEFSCDFLWGFNIKNHGELHRYVRMQNPTILTNVRQLVFTLFQLLLSSKSASILENYLHFPAELPVSVTFLFMEQDL